MAVNDFVQVAPDGLGKKIRNLTITAMVPDGVGGYQSASIEMQVVAISDAQGNVLSLDGTNELLERIVDGLEAVRAQVERLE